MRPAGRRLTDSVRTETAQDALAPWAVFVFGVSRTRHHIWTSVSVLDRSRPRRRQDAFPANLLRWPDRAEPPSVGSDRAATRSVLLELHGFGPTPLHHLGPGLVHRAVEQVGQEANRDEVLPALLPGFGHFHLAGTGTGLGTRRPLLRPRGAPGFKARAFVWGRTGGTVESFVDDPTDATLSTREYALHASLFRGSCLPLLTGREPRRPPGLDHRLLGGQKIPYRPDFFIDNIPVKDYRTSAF